MEAGGTADQLKTSRSSRASSVGRAVDGLRAPAAQGRFIALLREAWESSMRPHAVFASTCQDVFRSGFGVGEPGALDPGGRSWRAGGVSPPRQDANVSPPDSGG